MTFDQFLAKYNGQSVEAYDPSNLDQCVDLATQYCVDVLGLPNTIFAGLQYAFQIWIPSTTLVVSKFDYIDNTLWNSPQKGDIVIFNQNIGIAGHVSIATGSGNALWFQSFDQNWDTKNYNKGIDKDTGLLIPYSRLVTHSYWGVLGWLRAKPQSFPHEDLAKQYMQSALNETVTASQQNDPNFKSNMSQVKTQAQQVFNML